MKTLVKTLDGYSRLQLTAKLPLIISETLKDRVTLGRLWVLARFVRELETRRRVPGYLWSLYCLCCVVVRII